MKSTAASVKEWTLSSLEPSGLSKKTFYSGNFLLFTIIKCLLWFFGKDEITKDSGFSILNSWVVFFLIFAIWILIKNHSNFWRFIGLTIYAQNRSLVFRLLLRVLIFPLELIATILLGNYMSQGFRLVSLTTKVCGYIYFYYLFLGVCIKLGLKANIRSEE